MFDLPHQKGGKNLQKVYTNLCYSVLFLVYKYARVVKYKKSPKFPSSPNPSPHPFNPPPPNLSLSKDRPNHPNPIHSSFHHQSAPSIQFNNLHPSGSFSSKDSKTPFLLSNPPLFKTILLRHHLLPPHPFVAAVEKKAAQVANSPVPRANR